MPFEKVNPDHPDKQADRIGGAIVDLAYKKQSNPKIAGELLLGHGKCHIICETSVHFELNEIEAIVKRITKIDNIEVDYKEVPQDVHLAENQKGTIRCGDNGIFHGSPLTQEQIILTKIAHEIYEKYPFDGKYLIDGKKLVVCQSNANTEELKKSLSAKDVEVIVNPLGDWTGGTDVDTGAVNRKLGSDMGDSMTGGGIHFKDFSKADVSVNIYCYALAQRLGTPVWMSCAIGDEEVCGIPYKEIVDFASDYVKKLGGFEKLAEWGLIR